MNVHRIKIVSDGFIEALFGWIFMAIAFCFLNANSPSRYDFFRINDEQAREIYKMELETFAPCHARGTVLNLFHVNLIDVCDEVVANGIRMKGDRWENG